LLDSRLYLPQDWFSPEATQRREDCRIPADITLQTKPQLAAGLLKDLIVSGLFAGRWITFDCSFGNNDDFLEVLPPGYLYLAEIACTRKVWIQSAPKHRKLETEGCTVDLPFEELVRVSGARWPIERCFQEEKSDLGLDHYEHRSWPAWHRHTRLVSLAQLFLLRLRHKFKKKPRP